DDDDSRSRSGSHRQRHDTRAGQGGKADNGFRRALQYGHRFMDYDNVCGSGIQEFKGEEIMRKLVLFAVTAMLLVCASAYAHHSYAATYDTTKEIKLVGKLVQFSLKNPHSYVTILAPNAKGAMQRWSIEWAGTSQLNSRGINNDTLKIGDQVTI